MPDDQLRAAALAAHRTLLQTSGGELASRPWQHPGQPPSDADLVRLATWKAADADVDPQIVTAGLGLLESARQEIDQAEAALLFAARAGGLTFQQIAAALGLGSSQAAQQRMARVIARLETRQ